MKRSITLNDIIQPKVMIKKFHISIPKNYITPRENITKPAGQSAATI